MEAKDSYTHNSVEALMIPTFKPQSDLSQQDFAEHAVWVCWYEPDEMECLVELGFDEEGTRRALESIGYSDSFAFPIPSNGVGMLFKYLMVSARLRTPSGTWLSGYCSNNLTVAFHNGHSYYFNPSLPDLSTRTATDLSDALGEAATFPLFVEVPLLGTSTVLPVPGKA